MFAVNIMRRNVFDVKGFGGTALGGVLEGIEASIGVPVE
jgi:hypothetical protein